MPFQHRAIASVLTLLAVLHSAQATAINWKQAMDLNNTIRTRNVNKRDDANVNGFRDNGGYLNYEGFNSDEGTLGASALMNSDTYWNLRKPTAPDRSIEPSGWEDLPVPEPKGSHRNRCHLIGAQLGGSNKDGRNFVTCHRNANSPIMAFYEKKVANLLASVDRTSPWKRDKGVLFYAIPEYGANLYPERIRVRSELYMSGVFQEVLQDLYVWNRDANGKFVTFECRGTWVQDGPPSLPADRISKSTSPCAKAVEVSQLRRIFLDPASFFTPESDSVYFTI